MRIPIAKDAYSILVFLIVIGAIASIWVPVGLWIGLGLALAVALFFRDPERKIEIDPSLVYAPADGKITQIKDVEVNGTQMKQIVIFLSVFNCHINRIPCDGTVKSSLHLPGKFLAAYRKDIEEKNERQDTWLDTKEGPVRIIQITGAIARRIVCRLRAGDRVKQGTRFGLIKFGSRTDLYLPAHAKLTVKVGQAVTGGKTVFARYES